MAAKPIKTLDSVYSCRCILCVMRPQIVLSKRTVTESLRNIFKANNLSSFFSVLDLFQNFNSVKLSDSHNNNLPMQFCIQNNACYQTNVPFVWSILHLTRSESKHTSASRKILAQVQEASRRMASELEGKHPNSKVWVWRLLTSAYMTYMVFILQSFIMPASNQITFDEEKNNFLCIWHSFKIPLCYIVY